MALYIGGHSVAGDKSDRTNRDTRDRTYRIQRPASAVESMYIVGTPNEQRLRESGNHRASVASAVNLTLGGSRL